MKQKPIQLIAAILFLASFSACLDFQDTKNKTADDEQKELKEFLAVLQNNGNDIDTTELGVYYVTLKEGTGDFAKTGDTLKVGFAGYFISGEMFDSSFEGKSDSTVTFVLGYPPAIKGWDDGMKVMKKNSKVQLIVPSSLAYGSTGSGIIPAYQSLVFVVIMKDIKSVES